MSLKNDEEILSLRRLIEVLKMELENAKLENEELKKNLLSKQATILQLEKKVHTISTVDKVDVPLPTFETSRDSSGNVFIRYSPIGECFHDYFMRRVRVRTPESKKLVALVQFMFRKILQKLKDLHEENLFAADNFNLQSIFLYKNEVIIQNLTNHGTMRQDMSSVKKILKSVLAELPMELTHHFCEFIDLEYKLTLGTSSMDVVANHPCLWSGPKKANFIRHVHQKMCRDGHFSLLVDRNIKKVLPNAKVPNAQMPRVFEWTHLVKHSFMSKFQHNRSNNKGYHGGSFELMRFGKNVINHGHEYHKDHPDVIKGVDIEDMVGFLRDLSDRLFFGLHHLYISHYKVPFYVDGIQP